MSNGNGNGQPTIEDLTEAVEDAVTYPILTADSGSVGSRGTSGGGAGSGSHIGGIADQAFREAIGWRYRRGDHRGFVAAITKAFDRTEVKGRVEMKWRPQSYSVAADLGELTGALASLHQQATTVVERALPLLDALTPLSSIADLEDVATIRSLIRDELGELLTEFARPGGPRVARVDNYFDLLLGREPESDPLEMGGQMRILRQRFGLRHERVNTVEEERNYTNYLILADQIYSLSRMWRDKHDEFAAGGGQFLGVQLVSLSHLLAVIGESVQEAYAAMDSVFISRAEREVYQLQLDENTNMTIAELFSWAESFAATEGPRLLAHAGKDGVGVFHQTVTRLHELIELARQIAPAPLSASSNPKGGGNGAGSETVRSGFGTKRVQRALQELERHVNEAKIRSGNVRRTEVNYQEEVTAPTLKVPKRAEVTAPVITSIDRMSAEPGKTFVMRILGRRLKHGAAPTFDGEGVSVQSVEWVSESELRASVKVDANAPLGVRSLTLVQGKNRAELPFSLEIARPGRPELCLHKVTPDRGVQGQTLDVVLSGENFTTLPSVDFESGVEINSIAVEPMPGPRAFRVNITISDGADLEPRKVTMWTADDESSICPGFTVQKAGGGSPPPQGPQKPPSGKAPGVRELTPTELKIGKEGVLTIRGDNLRSIEHIHFEGLESGKLRAGGTGKSIEFDVAVMAGIKPRDVKVVLRAGKQSYTAPGVLKLVP